MQLQAEAKLRPLILVDRRGYFELQEYIEKKKSAIMRPFRELVKDMQSLVTIENSKRIIQLGGLPNDMRDGWLKMITATVTDGIMPASEKTGIEAHEKIRAKIERARKGGILSPLVAIANWVKERGGELITNLTVAQMANAQAIIHHQVIWNVTSPYQLARVIRPAVGLTQREAVAVSRFYSGLLESGVGEKAASAQLEKYANYLHRVRSERIARTEISNAYNFGQWESIRNAQETGLIDGEVEKAWIAGGPNPCDDCLGNEDEGLIPMNQDFSSGHSMPTAHPCCACSVGYQVRR